MQDNMIIYVSKDENVKVDVNIQNEDIWMSQDVMANLYGTTKQNISYHLNNVFKEAELDRNSVVKDFLTTASDGKNIKHYIIIWMQLLLSVIESTLKRQPNLEYGQLKF